MRLKQTLWFLVLTPTLVTLSIPLAYYLFVKNKDFPTQLVNINKPLYEFLLNKWYFDEIYDILFVKSSKKFGLFLWKFFDVKVIDGFGSAPLPPPAPDFLIGMGRTNDAILYGGLVHLYVDTPNDDAEELAKRLPSSTSKDYGKPFADIFKEYKYDFYQIDKMLFSPAKVIVSSLKTGKSYTSGNIDLSLMDNSFNK